MIGEGPVAVENVPLNLRVRRVPYTKVERVPSKQTLQLLSFIVPGALLVAACRRGGRFAIPAAVGLATGSIAALATAIVANRRQCAREAVLDDRIEQSFPASDPPSH